MRSSRFDGSATCAWCPQVVITKGRRQVRSPEQPANGPPRSDVPRSGRQWGVTSRPSVVRGVPEQRTDAVLALVDDDDLLESILRLAAAGGAEVAALEDPSAARAQWSAAPL